MIIQNGYIQIREDREFSDDGLDPETGYPLSTYDEVFGKPIPCQYIATAYNFQGRVGTEHVIKSKYSILIDREEFKSERIKLTNLKGDILGVFSILQIEPLEAVCQTRIFV